LYVLRNVYTALACDIDGFSSLRLRQPMTLTNACIYLAKVGWCYSELRSLIGCVRNIFDVYTGGVGRTTTVELVHTLLSTGEFSIAMPGAVFTAVATFNGEEKTLNAVELGDIPFELCLTEQ
jgi:hypothetical protein